MAVSRTHLEGLSFKVYSYLSVLRITLYHNSKENNRIEQIYGPFIWAVTLYYFICSTLKAINDMIVSMNALVSSL